MCVDWYTSEPPSHSRDQPNPQQEQQPHPPPPRPNKLLLPDIQPLGLKKTAPDDALIPTSNPHSIEAVYASLPSWAEIYPCFLNNGKGKGKGGGWDVRRHGALFEVVEVLFFGLGYRGVLWVCVMGVGCLTTIHHHQRG